MNTSNAQAQSVDFLCCPKCKTSLQMEGASIHCKDCDFKGESKDGIFDLRSGRLDYYFNPVPKPLMNELVESTDHKTWAGTIRSFMSSVGNNPDWLDNLVVDGRYAWKMFLNLPENAAVLDLGCGLGNLTHNLAPQVGKVYALDLTWERLKFTRLRCSLFNAGDDVIYIAGGDGKFLPFPDESLDCVTLSGVLEWIPDNDMLWETEGGKLARALKMLFSFFGTTNPRKIQIAFLKEIKRVLKPEGQLFIGIENRLNYEYFLGRPDHHSVLKYGSLLPRFLANIYSIYKRRIPYRTYTHSLRGYRKLLKSAGFNNQSFFGLLDGYSKLREIVNIDFTDVSWKPFSYKSIKDRLKHYELFVPAYGILASQEKAKGTPLILELFEEIGMHLTHKGGEIPEIEQFLVSGKDKAIILIRNSIGKWILKVPFSNYGEQAERNGALILQNLARSKELTDIIPETVSSGTIRGLPYFVETNLPGVSLVEILNDQSRDSISLRVFALWEMFSGSETFSRTLTLDENIFRELAATDFDAIHSVTVHPEKIQELMQFTKDQLLGCEVTLGLTHGDFSIRNILSDSSGNLRVIDWETAKLEGFVIFDVINFLDSIQRGLDTSANILNTLNLLINESWPCETEYKFLNSAMEDCGFHQKDQKTAVILLYWMHHIRLRLEAGMVFDNLQIDESIDKFLLTISESISKAKHYS